jgi:hypothetical protein
MAEGRQIPEATHEHRLLKEHVGTWKVACTYFMDPTKPPMEVTATETIEMLGEFWTRSVFRADIGGFMMEGSATVGYDPEKGKWVSTWIDNGIPFLFYFEGDLDESIGALEMTGTGPSPIDGGPTTYRTVETVIGPDERTVDLFFTLPAGDEVQMFAYTYTREG